jgi:hypothetical protein
MPSKRKIARFAQSWMDWYPETTETDLRDCLHRRFLKGLPKPGEVDVSTEEGCLFLLLAPFIREWRRTFPIDRRQVATDINAVLGECRAQFGWPAGNPPDQPDEPQPQEPHEETASGTDWVRAVCYGLVATAVGVVILFLIVAGLVERLGP